MPNIPHRRPVQPTGKKTASREGSGRAEAVRQAEHFYDEIDLDTHEPDFDRLKKAMTEEAKDDDS
jgi:hypothetical protein